MDEDLEGKFEGRGEQGDINFLNLSNGTFAGEHYEVEPSSRANSTPAVLVIVIWVEA